MISRRDILTAAAAFAVGASGGNRSGVQRAMAQSRISEAELLRFPAVGQVTLLHVADLHAQMVPVYFREPSLNLGAGDTRGKLPHLTDTDLLSAFGIAPGTLEAYALTSVDFADLARTFGKLGGLDRIARIVAAVRGERGANRTLLLDGGDALQGSYVSLQNRGADMVDLLARLGVEATTGHWEFTLGADRVTDLYGRKGAARSGVPAFLASNIVETDFLDPVFDAVRHVEKGGVPIAIIGQAFPYTPIANPRWMMPDWSFGLREAELRHQVEDAREAGAQLVVLLSHNGFDVDRKLASRVEGIDVILTAHTHDALPQPVRVGSTLLIASGSSGKFVSRLDIEMSGGRVSGHAFRLIPVVADAITPDPEMAEAVARWRAPHRSVLEAELGRAETLLWRRGNFNGTLDDVICDALLSEHDAEIALSPGFRWGTSLLPGSPITGEDLYNVTAITYPAVYRNEMSGRALKDVLEDVADNLFNPDPYYQQGGDMVRVGGLGFSINPSAPFGQRIGDLVRLPSNEPIEAGKTYIVAGWASVNPDVSGPPVWDLVTRYLNRVKTVAPRPSGAIRLVEKS